eukprot:1159610-Pelagomonas_calceolata.AAC.1
MALAVWYGSRVFVVCPTHVRNTPHEPKENYAYKLASTRRAIEETSLTSHHRDQARARATANNPPDPY